MVDGVNLGKKALLGFSLAIAGIVILFLPLSLGLMAGFPFGLWTDDEAVRSTPTPRSQSRPTACFATQTRWRDGSSL